MKKKYITKGGCKVAVVFGDKVHVTFKYGNRNEKTRKLMECIQCDSNNDAIEFAKEYTQ